MLHSYKDGVHVKTMRPQRVKPLLRLVILCAFVRVADYFNHVFLAVFCVLAKIRGGDGLSRISHAFPEVTLLFATFAALRETLLFRVCFMS